MTVREAAVGSVSNRTGQIGNLSYEAAESRTVTAEKVLSDKGNPGWSVAGLVWHFALTCPKPAQRMPLLLIGTSA
jgi:hypothetical protein